MLLKPMESSGQSSRLLYLLTVLYLVLATCLLFNIPTTSLVDAANPVSFCKCACGQNVTIIELTPKDGNKPNTAEDCFQCTKTFCLLTQKDFCSGAGANDDLTAFCFQRDSYKDEFIVYLFLVITIGLLILACARPYLGQFIRYRRLWNN
ncbi:hypothetical protein BDF19DRAFT_397803 [Syncephalis fuscata]|nr:hypothetical protein BDF19DRAFT_397803 [Syncephalis fuscata]